MVNNRGAAACWNRSRLGRDPLERILLYGIAVDDAHHFKDLGNPKLAGPGRGGSWSARLSFRRAPFSRRWNAATYTRPPRRADRLIRLVVGHVGDGEEGSFAKYRIQLSAEMEPCCTKRSTAPPLPVPRKRGLRARARPRKQRAHCLVSAVMVASADSRISATPGPREEAPCRRGRRRGCSLHGAAAREPGTHLPSRPSRRRARGGMRASPIDFAVGTQQFPLEQTVAMRVAVQGLK